MSNNNLGPHLSGLYRQGNDIQASVLVILKLHEKHAYSSDVDERHEYAAIILLQTEALQTNLSMLHLGAGLVSDDGMAQWCKAATNAADKKARVELVSKLMAQMAAVEHLVGDLTRAMGG